MDLAEKRAILIEVFAFKEADIHRFDDTKIEHLFLSKIRKVARDLERDLRDIS